MDEIINQIQKYVTIQQLIYIGIALLVIIILLIILAHRRKKKAKKLIDTYEERYQKIKSVPLAFKVNKADALAKVNLNMVDKVNECNQAYDEISDELKTIRVELATIDDMVYSRKVKQGLKRMKNLEQSFQQLEAKVDRVNGELDGILEREKEQRVSINELKDEFRIVKSEITNKQASFSPSFETLEKKIAEIEKKFSTFEDWMFASEFNKASEQQDLIRDDINELKLLVDVLPPLYEKAQGIVPTLIDECSYMYAQAKNKGVHLNHLQVHENLDFVSDRLKECLEHLRNAEIENVNEDLDDCIKRIEQLKQQIQKEDKAFDDVNGNVATLFNEIETMCGELDGVIELYNRVYQRFGFENWNDRITEENNKRSKLIDMKRKLEKVLAENNIAYTQIIIAYKEVEQSAHMFHEEVIEMQEKLHNACSDEERAKNQLIKLQLALNESRVKMVRYHLPSVSNKYEADLYQGEVMVRDIKLILANSPLDVKRMNEKLTEAIDFIYALYNNVNNLVGIANMVEKLIVFGNRYRSSYPDIDSELTRADLCFRNGQYTKALKICMQCIEKMHPGAYKKLIGNSESEVSFSS